MLICREQGSFGSCAGLPQDREDPAGGNYEVNVEVADDAYAAHLEHVFTNDVTNARRLTADHWQRRPVAAKVSERVLAPLRPLFERALFPPISL